MDNQVNKILDEIDPDKVICVICEKYFDVSETRGIFSHINGGIVICNDCYKKDLPDEKTS